MSNTQRKSCQRVLQEQGLILKHVPGGAGGGGDGGGDGGGGLGGGVGGGAGGVGGGVMGGDVGGGMAGGGGLCAQNTNVSSDCRPCWFDSLKTHEEPLHW